MKHHIKSFLGLLLSLALAVSFAQTRITNIDGVYIERENTTLPVNKTVIRDGDIITFDIPGFNDYMEENGQLLQDVHLCLDRVELDELPAFVENAESGVVRFAYAEKSITSEHRQILFKSRLTAQKSLRIGIKPGDANAVYFGGAATVFFNSLKYWSWVGTGMIGMFFVFFLLLIYQFKSLIKDGVKGIPNGQEVSATYSFSKSQFAFWTFIVVSCFIYVWALTGDINSINNTGLVLLGISSITISAGSLINKSKLDDATTEGAAALTNLLNYRTSEKNFFRDILSDKDGISIHRFQALVFNIVFGVAFVKTVIIDYAMPEFNETQFILLGLSNGTYAFLKNNETA